MALYSPWGGVNQMACRVLVDNVIGYCELEDLVCLGSLLRITEISLDRAAGGIGSVYGT